jgi:4-amino-4-deoxy-L-arabinose transferase-like glycosyltransferase
VKILETSVLPAMPAIRPLPDRWTQTQRAVAIIAVLTALRFVLASSLPLSFDESYFWLWSKHLAVSYYDHPPLIALAIRAGTLLFGDTEFGVRFVSLVLSVAASVAVWRSAAIICGSDAAGAKACCLFNATLMMATESMSATPDALVLCASAFLILAIAELETTNDGRWWLGAGLAAGLALFSKYTAFFLCGSIAGWLAFTPQGRKWLRTPWPYLGAALACAFLVSTIVWNAQHGWISFKFQFGRVGGGHLTVRYLAELVGSQIALASPFILLLGLAGLGRETFTARLRGPLAFSAFVVWPPLVYFLFHALHERVQGNWPSFIYPALVLLVASVFTTKIADRTPIIRWSSILALPVAICILLGASAQTAFDLVPMGYKDPVARMTAVGAVPVMEQIGKIARENHAAAIVTSKYVMTGWLSFYLQPHVPVVQVNEDYRWISSPRATTKVLNGPLIYVTQNPAQEFADVARHFSSITPIATIPRIRDGVIVDRFNVYRLSGFYGAAVGRMP